MFYVVIAWRYGFRKWYIADVWIESTQNIWEAWDFAWALKERGAYNWVDVHIPCYSIELLIDDDKFKWD